MIVDLLLAPARWLADRAWYALARRIMPLDDNLADVGDHDAHDCVDAECSFGFVPVATFDGHAVGERLDRDVAPTPARLGAVGVPRRLDERPHGVGR